MRLMRFLGIDDSFSSDRCVIVGVVTEGSSYVEGVMVDSLTVDGLEVTEKIIAIVQRSRFRNQIRCIFLSGITFGGFNLADIREISSRLSIPVVAVMRRPPDLASIMNALRNLDRFDERVEIVRRAGEVREADGVYVQFAGCSYEDALGFLKAATLKGNVPECMRIAHMIASAIIHGENRGRA